MSNNQKLWWFSIFSLLGVTLPMGWQVKADSVHSIRSTGDGVIVNTRAGPSLPKIGPITDWVSFVPNCTWTSNVTKAGYWRRVGQNMEIRYSITLTGAPNATTLTCDIPAEKTVDTSVLPNVGSYVRLGQAVYNDGNALFYNGDCDYSSTTIVRFSSKQVSGSFVTDQNVNQTIPFTWASGDDFDAYCSIPIANW